MADVDIVIAGYRGATSRVLGGVRSTSKNRSGRPATGKGYLAGEYPEGITSVDGVPTPATVRILYRAGSGKLGDGFVVAEVQSGIDGTWRVDGLNPALRFDVVARKDGFKDVIVSNVSPEPYVE